MMKDTAAAEIDLLTRRYPALAGMRAELLRGVDMLARMYRRGGKLLVCGNGGSAADSQHIVGELMKGFVLDRPLSGALQRELTARYPQEAAYYIGNLQSPIPAVSLVGEAALTSAYGNDKAPDLTFAQQVLGYGRPGDLLLAISTSGSSANVVHAARIAKALGLEVVSLTGRGGGRLAALSDLLLAVPEESTYRIQELHLPIYHALCLAVEKELFDE